MAVRAPLHIHKPAARWGLQALALAVAVLPVALAAMQAGADAAPAASAVAPRTHAQNIAMLSVLKQVLAADMRLSRTSSGAQLRRYIYALNYVDVSGCPAEFQSDWANYLKTCEKLDRATRMAHWDPRLALVLKPSNVVHAKGRPAAMRSWRKKLPISTRPTVGNR